MKQLCRKHLVIYLFILCISTIFYVQILSATTNLSSSAPVLNKKELAVGSKSKESMGTFVTLAASSSSAPPQLSRTSSPTPSGTPPASSLAFAKIRQMQLAGKYNELLKEFTEQIEKIPEEEKAKWYLLKALASEEVGNHTEVVNSYKKIINLNSLLQDYTYFFWAEYLKKMGDYEGAIENYKKVADCKPNRNLLKQSQISLNLLLIEKMRYPEALRQLSKLEKKYRRDNSSYPEIIYSLSLAEKKLGKGKDFCKHMKILFTKYPLYSKIINWGPHLEKNDFLGTPTNCIADIKDIKARVKKLIWIGQEAKAQQEIEALKPIMVSEKVYEFDMIQAQFLIQTGELQKASKILQNYYSSKKTDFEYLMFFAFCSSKLGEFKLAVETYYLAYKYAKTTNDKKQALFQSAFQSYQIKEYELATKRFQEFLTKFSSSGMSEDVRWYLSWMNYLQGQYEKSFNEIKKYKNSLKKSASVARERATYWMGMSLYRLAQYEDAKPFFEMIAKDPLHNYYSVVAQYRLKKITELAPQLAQRRFVKRYTRFVSNDSLHPDDEENFHSLNPNKIGEEKTEASELITLNERVANDEAASSPIISQENSEEERLFDGDNLKLMANPLLLKKFQTSRALVDLGFKDWAKWELLEIERKTSNKDYLKSLITEYESIDCYQCSSYIGQIYFGTERANNGYEAGRFLWEAAYPKAYDDSVQKYAKQFNVPIDLIWSVMKTESNYKKDVISTVGAIGLMQVMPSTGEKLAKLLNEKNFKSQDLFIPDTSIKVGSRYLRRLMERFDQSIPLVAASYNAGPHRVLTWLSSFGQLETDEFIEHIPFTETRNYVKKVISNYSIYGELYRNQKDGMLAFTEHFKVKTTGMVAIKEFWDDI